MSDRIVTPIIALGLAVLVWLYTRSRDQEVLDNYVEIDLQVDPAQADSYELEIKGPSEKGSRPQVRVSFAGPPSRIRELRAKLNKGQVRLRRAISVPKEMLGEKSYADEVRLHASEIPVPSGVQAVIAENQNRIDVVLWRLVQKDLRVVLKHDAPLDRIEHVIVDPSMVRVRGRQAVLDRVDVIPTEQYSISPTLGATTPYVTDAPVLVPLAKTLEGRPIQPAAEQVAVRFRLRPQQKEHNVDVPVHFLCPANFPYRPLFTHERDSKITLKVRGPLQERLAVTAYVDLAGQKFGVGLHASEPIRVQLPPGFELVQEPPKLSSFRLVPAETPIKPAETAYSPP
jgi:hypothetical protein